MALDQKENHAVKILRRTAILFVALLLALFQLSQSRAR